MLVAKNVAHTSKGNRISEPLVKSQLESAPGPNDKTKSGYPHKYQDFGSLIPRRPERSDSMESTATCTTTTSYREYPVFQNGNSYNYNSKPKDNPGPFRGITNQNGNYRATICHDGAGTNPNAGNFHLCEEEDEEDEDED
ncbi:hypothetical protein BDZ45DRAFT_208989 [Acephala macrosclerotiorum]|nr:hypothetical protein BDZ45DRAFT_208989 [Acephala macrosclerotiorum]